MNLPRIAVGLGVVLVVQGVVIFFLSESRSPTALIPALVGVPIFVAGLVGARPGYRAYAMHAAAACATTRRVGRARTNRRGRHYARHFPDSRSSCCCSCAVGSSRCASIRTSAPGGGSRPRRNWLPSPAEASHHHDRLIGGSGAWG